MKSLGGVYPDTEIQTASHEELEQAYSDYYADAHRRIEHDLKSSQRAAADANRTRMSARTHRARCTSAGSLAVMGINRMLTKMMFDANPDHEFYVEESFPMDWMYPYLTPFGIIMKVNRQPVRKMTEEMMRRDHEFWSHYSERLVGNWITYDTTAKEIVRFCGEGVFAA